MDYVDKPEHKHHQNGGPVRALFATLAKPLGKLPLALALVVAAGVGAGCDEEDSGPAPPTGPADYVETTAGLNIELVHINGGGFLMGSPTTDQLGYDDERPTHQVTLRSYYIGRFELTQDQWQKVMGDNPSGHQGCPTCPVENVSLLQVNAFIEQLNTLTGLTYRLPTEAEWEHACRAGTETPTYFGGDEAELVQHGWSEASSEGSSHPVGEKLANPFGLYDMYGNVEEWVEDWYGFDFYAASPEDNPVNEDPTSELKVNRGGSFKDKPWLLRSAYRMWNAPDYRFNGLGLRIARSAE